MLESAIDQKARRSAKALGMVYIKLSPLGLVGIPDRIVLAFPGRVMFLELKRPQGVMAKRQKVWQERLRALHFLCFAPFGADETLVLINKFARGEL